jgi:potassium efflux system protein
VSVRDVPALLELVVLQHLPLDSGARYAFTSMSRYVLAAIGLTASFNAIGGEWAKIQWLVAAMSVGLGFGLQEIFANFVSGIILLFERPIRVGDVVTLGDTTGVVNRIRMRATTIVDHDRKEYIVPNKDLVAERLLNWTLSDQTNRIVVMLGVAYGSDTRRACDLLLDAARAQPHVLKDPPPVAFFDNFGESSLNLKLLCYLPSLENRLTTIHNLNSAIDRLFKEAGLEIPFPQRDLHVRFDRDSFTIDAEGSKVVAARKPKNAAEADAARRAGSEKQDAA